MTPAVETCDKWHISDIADAWDGSIVSVSVLRRELVSSMYLLFGKRHTSTHRRFRQVSSQGFERFVMLIKWTDSTVPALYRGMDFYKVRIFVTYINTVHSVLKETLIGSSINGTLLGHPKLAIDQVSKT